jgi:lysophospholipase L1-like esterase
MKLSRRQAIIGGAAVSTMVIPESASATAPKPAQRARGPVTLLCVGDSCTVGVGSGIGPSGVIINATDGGYRTRLQGRLEDRGHDVTPLAAAASGMTLDRIRPLVDAAVAQVPDSGTLVSCWWIGNNDIKWFSAANPMAGWPERYAYEVSRVLAMFPTSYAVVATCHLQPGTDLQLFRNVNEWLRNMAGNLGDRVRVADLEQLPAEMLADKVHPSRPGYEFVAAEMLQAMRSWL